MLNILIEKLFFKNNHVWQFGRTFRRGKLVAGDISKQEQSWKCGSKWHTKIFNYNAKEIKQLL